MADNEIQILVRAEVDRALKNIKNIETQTRQSTTKMGGAINKLRQNWVGIAAGVGSSVLIFKKLIGVAKDFEQSIANVASVTGIARKELEAIAREAGRNTVFSAKEAADALFELGKAGLNTADDLKNALNPALRLATAGQLSLADASATVVKVTNVFGLSMEDSGNTVDVLAKAANSAATSVSEMSEAIKFAAPIASLAGFDLEETSGVIAQLANNGITASMAGTTLRQALIKLAEPTDKGRAVLAKYSISVDQVRDSLGDPVKLFKLLRPAMNDVTEASALLGARSSALSKIINQTDGSLENMITSLRDAAGTAEELEKERLDTLSGSLRLLRSAFEDVILGATGDGGLRDSFRGLIDILVIAVRAFGQAPGYVKALSIGIIGLTPAIIALNAALGPIGIALVALGAALPLVIGAFGDFSDVSTNLEEVTDRLLATQEEYADVIKKLNDPTDKLTKSEKALLEVRKQELELNFAEDIAKLIEQRNKLALETTKTAKEEKRLAKELEQNRQRVAETAELQELLIKARKGDSDALKELTKRQKEVGFTFKSLAREVLFSRYTYSQTTREQLLLAKATDFVKKRQEELQNTVTDSNKARRASLTLQNTENQIVEKLAQAIVNQKNNADALKVTEQDRIPLGIELNKRIDERVKALEAEAAATKNLTAAQSAAPPEVSGGGITPEQAESKKQLFKDISEFARETEQETQIELLKQEQALQNELKKLKEQGLLTDQEFAVAQVDIATESAERRKELELEVAESRKQSVISGLSQAQAFSNQLTSIVNQGFNNRISSIDAELQANLDSLEQQGLSEEEYQAKKAELEAAAEAKRKQVKRKQFIADKTASIISAIIATALSVAKALPNIPLAIISGVLGAAQIALIAAQPIPQFQEGGISQGGLALVGEQGAELVNLPRGAEVSTAAETSRILNNRFSVENITLPGVRNGEQFYRELQTIQRRYGALTFEN